MTVADREYKSLLIRELPRAIHSDEKYRAYLSRAEELMDKKPRSPAEDQYLELLSILIERFEEEKNPINVPDPIAALRELMAANGMSQADLSRVLGSSGNTSEILSRKRALSKNHIRKLAQFFNVPAGLFV